MAFDPNSPSESHAVLSGDVDQIRENCVQLRKNESGAVAPSNLVAGMLWHDTTGPYLKVRKADNGSWLYVLLGTPACTEGQILATPAEINKACDGILVTAEEINAAVSVISGGHLALTPAPLADGGSSGLKATMTVDANTVGVASALHLDADGNWIEADANVASAMPCTALALESGTGSKSVLFYGFMRKDAWAWTIGAPIYVSTTVGVLTQTAPSAIGDQVQVVGIATHADRMFFNPNYIIAEVK